jgi:demethylmenaquinone methyltransferase/2-methoxy-6-polyprenyl-1,4-benzoquinol methylase
MRPWGFDHFSLFAPFYDRLFAFRHPARLRELLALPTGGRLLDAGGGTGRVAQTLRGLAGQIVVIDRSAAMLRRAVRKEGLASACAHAEQLPFPDASFERILVVDAFHHLCDQRQAAAELWRVLATGGRLIIEEPNIETMLIKLVALGERLALMRSRFYTPHDIRDMFQALGARTEVHANHPVNVWIVMEK